MFHSKVHIEAGDLVIVFMTRDNMVAITIEPGEVFHNKFGKYVHDDFIGVKFGSKIHSAPPHSGYVYLLRPTPELWTLSLPHRTQILYMPDIAYITQRLGVRVGGQVIEAGTGSGSMTHSLSRTVGPSGEVRSFEYHKQRFEKAGLEFDSHGLKNVVLEHRNVCKDGFGDVTGVESVFLDLPAPWEAIPHAVKTLHPDMITKICCFSPCLEQVLKTVSALREAGFADISTQEVLLRQHELIPPPLASSSHLHDVSSIVQNLKVHEQKKAERRALQMKTARERARKAKEAAGIATLANSTETAPADGAEASSSKRKLDEAGLEGEEGAVDESEGKRPKTEANSSELVNGNGAENGAAIDGDGADEDDNEDAVEAPVWTEPTTALPSQTLTKPSAEMRGHTSYLTFAVYYPLSIRTALAEQGDKATTRRGTPSGVARVAELVKGQARAGSQDTATEGSEYGDFTIEQVMRTMTEEEMVALQASATNGEGSS